jgi:NADH dehydrogenase [ubiquinone] 1 alpha subcomplex assembly factor 7
MNELGKILKRRLALQGPMTVADFMNEALHHPRFGYYATRDPLGTDGDFTTAPEISQVFGELVGLWLAVVWQVMGKPNGVNLIELGPGRGTLMADVLRVAKAVPGFLDAVRLHLIESNPVLRDRQASTLSDSPVTPEWHDDFGGVADGPILRVANEFFDALPIRQFQKSESGWHERMVTTGEDDRFVFGLSPAMPVSPILDENVLDAAPGSIAEVSPAALSLVTTIGSRISRDGGGALIIDYGYERSQPGETLQAISRHRFVPVLDNPGTCDLTAHVDFAALDRAAAETGASTFGPISQGVLLNRLGLKERCEALKAVASPEQAADIETARNRLESEGQMGSLFKAIAFQHPALQTPPAFE